MPAKDIYHNAVKNALIKDGWRITHDPLILDWSMTTVAIDLAAESVISAERGDIKIAIEVKSFLRKSRIADLEQALGQYLIYLDALTRDHPDRLLYLAVPTIAYYDIVEQALQRLQAIRHLLRVVVYDPYTEVITQWIPQFSTTSK